MITDLPTKRIGLSNITVTKIYRRFTYKMASKNMDMKENYVTVTLGYCHP